MVHSGAIRRRLTPDERRAEIVRAADQVFQGRDPGAVTFEEIAVAAGVSRALVYNYFGDKGGLLAAVYRQSLASLDEELLEAMDANVTPRERIRQVVKRYVAFARAHAGGWHTLGVVAATQHPAVQRARSERFDRLATSWGTTSEARVVVAGLMGLLEAVVLDWLDNPTIEAERLVTLADELLWSGVEHLVGEGVVAPGARLVS
jgi:AcrR family transcriptional regulator